MIVVIDFGSQSTHLITRRLREISVDSILVEPEEFEKKTKDLEIKGIILSGGPQSVNDPSSPQIEHEIFNKGIPILGICYGQQYMARALGGEVIVSEFKELGPAEFITLEKSLLFALNETTQIEENSTVWMSHLDSVVRLPTGFRAIGRTQITPYAAIEHPDKQIYGVQFHPELIHTQFGVVMLRNFARICGLEPKDRPIDKEFVDSLILDIRESIEENIQVVGAMSGGVDSSIAHVLVHKAIGNDLTPIYIDSGLMRHGETDELRQVFEKQYDMDIEIVHAENEFLTNLKGVTDPEKKRKVIGKTFIDILQREANKRNAKYLVQGTIWPDVIESAGSKHSHTIKSHHNVGGLPEDIKLTLVEPLRNYYKDEVKQIGNILKLPDSIVNRKPFPGPGLAVRIIGNVTKEKCDIVRRADAIVQEEICNWDGYNSIWQIFAVFTGIKTTGVGGDIRSYGHTIAIRSVVSDDVMSARISRIPYAFLDTISSRITNEIHSVNRVLYDITNKPPGTIEWE